MAQSIENHAVIGDLRTAALVGLDASIDFLCWPRFDSPSIFASLLDDERGGEFCLQPKLDGARQRQLYLPDTNVLLTRFLSSRGVAEVSDFMVMAEGDPAEHATVQRLVRRVEAIRGPVSFTMRCAPRFDYARTVPDVTADGSTVVFEGKVAGSEPLRLRLHATTELRIGEGEVSAEFELQPGENVSFILEDACHGADSDASRPDYVADSFKRTSDYWRNWVRRANYTGRWRDEVTRSSLALKLMTSAEHGSMVAALTFGLPEEIGGGRNWDYRYTWLRDAAFTIYAFLRIGHVEEAKAFMHWLSDRGGQTTADGTLQIMYGIDGHSKLEEFELPHLRGYRDSTPVRVGNGAFNQLQLDIYGELMDAVYLSDKYAEPISRDTWQGIRRGMDWLQQNWQRPDEGIWEMRNGRKHYLHSRLMCWVAFDRAIRLSRKRGLPAPLETWLDTRDAIYNEIHDEFWDEKQRSFVQYKGGNSLDASCLLMPLVRFISPTDPRFLSTLEAVGRGLTDDSLVYRYSTANGADGLHGDEGTFTMCSFWYVECLARAGDVAQARFLFEKMLGYANHVGLFAEELGPAGEHLGNFPQAFTHLGLISAAYYLDRALSSQGR
ncbi:glycoside hydrolase family 15 protein [Acetobacteraceae bacterium KSS12]|uniref:Glycoside hydrolase family 15 protein n=1 Tax=Rhizosaccharibacter radicis TaxID=2782605 RepID=A0ABT1VXZ2_9PROT|nr:glycoside hydrolase family 15 protein [Acetobacteraceae bacterium KSS12]